MCMFKAYVACVYLHMSVVHVIILIFKIWACCMFSPQQTVPKKSFAEPSAAYTDINTLSHFCFTKPGSEKFWKKSLAVASAAYTATSRPPSERPWLIARAKTLCKRAATGTLRRNKRLKSASVMSEETHALNKVQVPAIVFIQVL
jgi:hypothetical protein